MQCVLSRKVWISFEKNITENKNEAAAVQLQYELEVETEKPFLQTGKENFSHACLRFSLCIKILFGDALSLCQIACQFLIQLRYQSSSSCRFIIGLYLIPDAFICYDTEPSSQNLVELLESSHQKQNSKCTGNLYDIWHICFLISSKFKRQLHLLKITKLVSLKK